MAVAGMFGFQILMGASSPGMYACRRSSRAPSLGPLGRNPELARQFAGRALAWLTGIIVDRTGTSRSPSWPPR